MCSMGGAPRGRLPLLCLESAGPVGPTRWATWWKALFPRPPQGYVASSQLGSRSLEVDRPGDSPFALFFRSSIHGAQLQQEEEPQDHDSRPAL